MNPSLDIADPATTSVAPPDRITIGDLGLRPDGSDAAGEAVSRSTANVSAAKVGSRVLLIEDDLSFNEIIRDFLTESGYTVIAVLNGGDGIREVLAGDFSVILCDMVMPTLPGDMFYRAVERARPHLCNRFVFMTGHRSDAKIDDFIRSIHAHGLRKPFHLDDLLCTIHLIEMCGHFTEAPAFAPAPARRAASAPNPVAPTHGNSLPPALAASPVEVVPRPSGAAQFPALSRESDLPANAPDEGREWSFLRVCRVLGAALALAAVPISWYFVLSSRVASSSTELSVLEWQWANVSRLVQEGEQARHGYDTSAGIPDRIATERKTPKWTPALRSVASAAGLDVELRGVELRGANDLAGACVLRLSGVSTGKRPQEIADRFRGQIESKLRQHFGGTFATARFERLDVAPESSATDPDHRKAAFSIIVTAGPNTAGESGPTRKL